ncbi:putative ABC-type Cd(2+) transporter [Dioscorea sansibarensis]
MARSRWVSKLPIGLGLGLGFGIAWQSSYGGDSSPAEKLTLAADGVVRSSRAVYTIAFIVADYKLSLRRLPSDSPAYRTKLSEVHLRSAKKLLRLCEFNKGFYVKAGQFISALRQVPKEYSMTLSSLQDQANPYPFKDIKEVIVKNLGKDLTQIFLYFDEQPIAAASIAQVHHGLLKDNQEVAVKVQYPGLKQRMKIDITTMSILSASISWIFPDYRFGQIVSEFERTMNLELDFIQEGNNSERTARNFKKNNVIKIPHVYWDLTTSQVLTMEFCRGQKVDDLDFLKQSGINPLKVAKALMDVFAEMIFVHGFVHGDPHPGNVLVSPVDHGGFSLVLLDHGIYTELDEMFRINYCQLWKALILQDPQKIWQLGEQLGIGKYSKYLPVIFTGRTMESKSVLGTQMSNKEKIRLKQELRSLKMDDLSSFMESLPPDFLSILRTDGLLRSILSKLSTPRHIRLLAYAKYAIYGLTVNSNTGFSVEKVLSRTTADITYLQLRLLLGILELVSKIKDMRQYLSNKMETLSELVASLYFRLYLFIKRAFTVL